MNLLFSTTCNLSGSSGSSWVRVDAGEREGSTEEKWRTEISAKRPKPEMLKNNLKGILQSGNKLVMLLHLKTN